MKKIDIDDVEEFLMRLATIIVIAAVIYAIAVSAVNNACDTDRSDCFKEMSSIKNDILIHKQNNLLEKNDYIDSIVLNRYKNTKTKIFKGKAVYSSGTTLNLKKAIKLDNKIRDFNADFTYIENNIVKE